MGRWGQRKCDGGKGGGLDQERGMSVGQQRYEATKLDSSIEQESQINTLQEINRSINNLNQGVLQQYLEFFHYSTMSNLTNSLFFPKYLALIVFLNHHKQTKKKWSALEDHPIMTAKKQTKNFLNAKEGKQKNAALKKPSGHPI